MRAELDGLPEIVHGDMFRVQGKPEELVRRKIYCVDRLAQMTLLEKIIYLADYVEPTRDFPGVEPLRALCYEDIDAAMALGLKMSLDELAAAGITPHGDSLEAYRWYKKG